MKKVLTTIVERATESNQADIYRYIGTRNEPGYHYHTNLTKMDKESRYTDAYYRHLYFTTDEQLMVGDIGITLTMGNLFKVNDIEHNGDLHVTMLTNSGNFETFIDVHHGKQEPKKIVATTNRDLHKSLKLSGSLPAPSKEFLKSYCDLKGIEKVYIEYTNHEEETGEFAHSDEELVPYVKVSPENTIFIHPIKKFWTQGEVEDILYKFRDLHVRADGSSRWLDTEEVQEFIEKNLK